MNEEAKPKYEFNEMIAMRVLDVVARPCTSGTVKATLDASAAKHGFTEEQIDVLLASVVEKGGAKRVGENGWQITQEGKSDLGPLGERPLSSFGDEPDVQVGAPQ